MATLPDAPPIDSATFEEITRQWSERAELINGDIYVIPPPSFRHQAVVGNLFRALARWVDAATDRGMLFDSPIDVQLSDRDRVQPDLAWWASGVDLDVQPAPPPDIAIEVLSPGTRRRDVGDKRLTYDRAGVAELWLVDPPARAVTILRRSTADAYDMIEKREGDETIETPLMCGLSIPAGPLFPA